MSVTLESAKKITELKQRLLTQAEAEYAELQKRESEVRAKLEELQREWERCRHLAEESWKEASNVSQRLAWDQYLKWLAEKIRQQEEVIRRLSSQMQQRRETLKARYMEERKWERYMEKRHRELLSAMRLQEQKVLDDLAIVNYRARRKRG
jgi:flagellar export protein FliJ